MAAKILLVEDEQFIREMYAHILNRADFTLEEADNGEDALAKIQNGSYDLILLDIMLPKINGLDILEKLSAAGQGEKAKRIILLTNLDEESTLKKGIGYGIRGYLVKSQNPPEKLADQITDFLKPAS